ncbi:MAG: hypothetical protein M3305_03130, partial [Actinomycetota bacterium]|nr:hypothetical protein [Actinomycetota bacterium]
GFMIPATLLLMVSVIFTVPLADFALIQGSTHGHSFIRLRAILNIVVSLHGSGVKTTDLTISRGQRP